MVLLNKYNFWDPTMMRKWDGSGISIIYRNLHITYTSLYIKVIVYVFIQGLLFSFLSSSQIRIYLLVNSCIRNILLFCSFLIWLHFLSFFLFFFLNDLEADVRKPLSLPVIGMFQVFTWTKKGIERTLVNMRFPTGV